MSAEDGGVTLNGAKVVNSFEFTDATKTGIVHEIDGFISPSIMWRYADQRESSDTSFHLLSCESKSNNLSVLICEQ